MRQVKIDFADVISFEKDLKKLKQLKNNKIFQIYSKGINPDEILQVCGKISEVFPDDIYFGCSTAGNIVDCQMSGKTTVVCTLFEKQDTRAYVFQYDLYEQDSDSITADILKKEKQTPNVKAIELYFTIPKKSTTPFCNGLKGISKGVHIFGGVSCSDDISSDQCLVFSKNGKISDNGVVVVFYSGEQLYIESINTIGWKPLWRDFHVTKSSGCVIYELDNIPAFDIYHKYLNINNDENFFYNALEFPLLYEHNGTTCLRTPVSSNKDGSITVTSDIDVGSTVRISYGDPQTILQSIEQDSHKMLNFQPDIMHIFSCAARKTFWGSAEPTYEIYPFKNISPSCGFFSHGEFMRNGENLNQHNVTLVVAGMKEGEKIAKNIPPTEKMQGISKKPLVSRLANFISATSLELEEINKKLEHVNQQLTQAAVIDGMTGLYNRKEIQFQIEQEIKIMNTREFSLIMLDIDNFKQVNDVYGHQEGDTVIISLADILKSFCFDKKISAGRWGGEEFMLLLRNTACSEALEVAESVRKLFGLAVFPNAKPQTISLGITESKGRDTIDSLCTRVDLALYEAKRTGKNKAVTL